MEIDVCGVCPRMPDYEFEGRTIQVWDLREDCPEHGGIAKFSNDLHAGRIKIVDTPRGPVVVPADGLDDVEVTDE